MGAAGRAGNVPGSHARPIPPLGVRAGGRNGPSNLTSPHFPALPVDALVPDAGLKDLV